MGLLTLSIKDSKDITDYGLTLAVRGNPSLQYLDISGCPQIGDVSIRELGLSCTNLQTLLISSCHNINGEGLLAVADCCRKLRTISLQRCRKLERYFCPFK